MKVKVKVKVKGLPPLPDPISFEGMLSDMFGDTEEETPLKKAQDMIYDAWEIATPKRRIELARKALEVSMDCADAYVLLAEEAATSPSEALDFYRQGVEAGERVLGKEAFEEDVGDFWGILETRPYMRARAGLAQCLWEVGQREEAVEHYIDMLRLNPNDNQGIRDLLMPCLIELGQDKDAESLFKKYKEDIMATWAYSQALLEFRRSGDSAEANKALAAAIRNNRHIPAYLLGRKKMPNFLPEYCSHGDVNEAVFYVHGNRATWQATPGALDWLTAHTK